MVRAIVMGFIGTAAWSAAVPALALEPYVATPAAKACPRHGLGFIELPGTTTCVRIGGRVVAEYGTSSGRISRSEISGFGTSARVAVDTRTDTAYGPLRSYVRVRVGEGNARRD